MFGLGRGWTPALVGWLWADLLLGLFVIFLAASAAPTRLPPVAAPTPAPKAVDPKPLELTVLVVGPTLLFGDPAAVEAERLRIAQEVERQVSAAVGQRRVAIALAFGTHEDPGEGDRLARIATERLRTDAFEGVVIKAYHSLVPGDRGSSVALELYFYY